MKTPHRNYTSFIATQNDKIKGFIVGYESAKSKGSAYIVDLLVKSGDQMTARALIKSLEEYFAAREIFAIYTWVPNGIDYKQAFKDSGYIFRKPTQPFIVRINSNDFKDETVYSFDKWFINMGDSDLH